ncbi:hypothetical protein DAMA08_038680 [Martiniozyma asiatica (nom. inval.)]|nr:hypothetical protein DAMA08_038680 [Martiniozyma asiatica]
MAYGVTFRPAVLLFFFIRQPVAASAIVGSFLFWEADRNFDLGVRASINNWRQNTLGFPTADSKYDAFKKIDEAKRQELLLKN